MQSWHQRGPAIFFSKGTLIFKKLERPGTQQPPAIIQMSSENEGRESKGVAHCSSLGISTVDESPYADAGQRTVDHKSESECLATSIVKRGTPNLATQSWDSSTYKQVLVWCI
ncbi:uncharacterized protein LOC123520848 [Portunus trituberculatus]|uniref:uncharacterized protein LOC123520848 n=1 Tax=Portunus trituberculatus TaxID=210409 RepID=UPI001E1D084C|nr:uncharacterized protein LOC123520848 [Portunus trituberculatus]